MMSTLRLRAAVGEDADERASGCLVAEAAEMTLKFRWGQSLSVWERGEKVKILMPTNVIILIAVK